MLQDIKKKKLHVRFSFTPKMLEWCDETIARTQCNDGYEHGVLTVHLYPSQAFRCHCNDIVIFLKYILLLPASMLKVAGM